MCIRDSYKLCKDLGTLPVVTQYEGPCFQHVENLSDGKGVIFCDNAANFRENVFTTKQVKGTEYRAYFINHEVVAIYRKQKLTKGPATPIKNSTNGYGYILNPKEQAKDLFRYIKELTLECSNRIGMSYGAVDFIVDKEYLIQILEANSAPTLLSEQVLVAFAIGINDLYGDKYES